MASGWTAMLEPELPQRILRIIFRGCSEQTRAALLNELPIHEGAVLSEELLQRAREAVKARHPGLTVLVRHTIRREWLLKLPPEARKGSTLPAGDDGVNVLIFDRTSRPQRIRVDEGMQATHVLEKVAARGPGRADAIPVAIVIGKDGSVMEADPLSGPESLTRPAVAAVRQWRYRPTLLNGSPVEVETVVEVDFARGERDRE